MNFIPPIFRINDRSRYVIRFISVSKAADSIRIRASGYFTFKSQIKRGQSLYRRFWTKVVSHGGEGEGFKDLITAEGGFSLTNRDHRCEFIVSDLIESCMHVWTSVSLAKTRWFPWYLGMELKRVRVLSETLSEYRCPSIAGVALSSRGRGIYWWWGRRRVGKRGRKKRRAVEVERMLTKNVERVLSHYMHTIKDPDSVSAVL